jgi:hypothetical protein
LALAAAALRFASDLDAIRDDNEANDAMKQRFALRGEDLLQEKGESLQLVEEQMVETRRRIALRGGGGQTNETKKRY